MAEREKVMKDLSWLIFNFPWQENPKDDADRMCNAIHTYCNDALALLKEQEPRVLTREEVMDLLQGSVAWYEEKSESGTYLRALVSAGNGFLGDFYLGINAHEFDFKRGRFWTARPSDEQRKAVKWDD